MGFRKASNGMRSPVQGRPFREPPTACVERRGSDYNIDTEHCHTEDVVEAETQLEKGPKP